MGPPIPNARAPSRGTARLELGERKEVSMHGTRGARAAGVEDGNPAQSQAKAYVDRTGVATESSCRLRGLALAARPRPPRKNHIRGIGRNGTAFQPPARFVSRFA